MSERDAAEAFAEAAVRRVLRSISERSGRLAEGGHHNEASVLDDAAVYIAEAIRNFSAAPSEPTAEGRDYAVLDALFKSWETDEIHTLRTDLARIKGLLVEALSYADLSPDMREKFDAALKGPTP